MGGGLVGVVVVFVFVFAVVVVDGWRADVKFECWVWGVGRVRVVVLVDCLVVVEGLKGNAESVAVEEDLGWRDIS